MMKEGTPPPASQRSEQISRLLQRREETKRLTGDLAPQTIDGTFTVETYGKFDPKELNVTDMLYVHTESGNIYRVARSRSRPGMLKIHNEKTSEMHYAVPTPGKSPHFETGQQMHYAALNDPDDRGKGAKGWVTSPIKNIEVWRNYVSAKEEIEKQFEVQARGGFGSALAAAAKNVASGTILNKDFRVKKKE